MASIPVALADAVTEHLNGEDYLDSFFAKRVYTPEYDADETGVQIRVVPRDMTGELNQRGERMRREYPVQIGIMKKYQNQSECDSLMETAERIMEDVKGLTIENDDVPRARVAAVEWSPNYAPELMRERRLFVSVVEITFLMQK